MEKGGVVVRGLNALGGAARRMSSEHHPSHRIPYHLILALYPQARWWEIGKPSPDSQRLAALAEIDAEEITSALPYIAPLAVVGNTAVRTKAAEVIARRFESALEESVAFLSLGLNQLVHYETAAVNALSEIKRETIAHLQVPIGNEWAVFGLLSFHGDGWVREAALVRLGALADGREIPFLLYRANDWVAPIAQKARELLASRLTALPIRGFSRHLPVLYQLRTRSRGYLSELQGQVVSRVAREEENAFLTDMATRTARPGFRRWLFQLALTHADVRQDAAALADGLRTHHDPVVRSIAWQRYWTTRSENEELKKGLQDSWPTIRRRCLELLCAESAAAQRPLLLSALLDSSAIVRATARYFLEQIGERQVADIYREQLRGASPSPAAIFGLSECGEKADAALLRPLLAASRVAVRRAAFTAVGNLDAVGFMPELKRALADPAAGVVKTVRQIFEKQSHVLSREFLLGLLDEEQPLHVRCSALRLIRALDKWERILALLEALGVAPEFNDTLRDEIQRWLATYNKNFALPSPAQATAMQQLCAKYAAMLPSPLDRELEHIAGSHRHQGTN